MREKYPFFLLAAYAVVFAWLGVAPYTRDVWWAENLPILLIVVVLVVLYARGIRFSATAYSLMSVLVFLHTVGGHYTFARVPFDWFNHLFGFERNMYDRVAHFSVGFYAYAIAELIDRRALTSSAVFKHLFALFAIVTLAAFYELFEWQYAVMADPAAGLEVLGSQGDIWDAQKDMLADTLGAVAALVAYALVGRGSERKA